MAELEQYKAKRNFKKTAEPAGGQPGTDKLLFVVQKHAASHLHYDFRLEVKGVLKSWAVPRGPSMDPEERRLAMPVEDHPYDYKDFEGIIPEGQYGGGTVIVWDEGWYEPATDEKLKDKAAKEHWMMSHYYKNALKITLHGHKLKGDFILIKMRDDKYDGGWRLIKADDEYATKDDILLKDKSVISKLTIEQMAEKKGAQVWNSNREPKKEKATEISIDELKKQGIKKSMPKSVKPMLCTLTKEVVADEDYLYEVKWDGYRIISNIESKKVRMDSRSALDYTKKYPPVATALKDLGHDAVLDGEVVVFNEEGKPDFDALQTFNGHDTPINYCVFDLLWLDGYNLMGLPLIDRKAILKELVKDNDVLRFSESFDDGEALYQQALDLDLEGIVAKRKDSNYVPDARDNRWLKTPTRKRQEFVIGGWAESDKSRSFRSLLFGAYNGQGKLEWIGRSGGGYKQSEMPGILAQLQNLEIDQTPFINKVLDTKGAKIHWVKPELVANFEFATWTKTGRIRKPATFLGFRKDKEASQVVREVPLSDAQEQQIIEEPKEQATITVATDSNWPKIENKKIESERDFEFAGHKVTINNIEQELWRGISKARLITYYHQICPYILPHLKDRPLSLHIKQDGANAPGFYIKDMEGHEPDYLDIFSDERRHKKKGKRDRIDYAVCNNEAALLYLINLGNIDLNPWSSRVTNPQEPDFISIDLDPSDEDFGKAIKTAQAAKKVFDQLKLSSFVKTSGKTGIHLFIPCQGFDFSKGRTLAEKLCDLVCREVPDIATTEVSIEHRGTKLFVDPSQNDYADTLACAYSVRPYKHPSVSTPLDWKEVKNKLDPGKFTMDTLPERLEKKGDLWADLPGGKKTIGEQQHFIKAAETMKFATYNINGINGRLENLLRWLKEADPNIVCLQELKCEQHKFPEQKLKDAGYNAIWQGQKSWNGVAILAKKEIKELRNDLPGDDDEFTHSRYIEAFIEGIVIGCIYLPNGNPWPGPKFDYKLRWFRRLADHAKDLVNRELPVILIGDYNVMPTELDTYKPEKYTNNALFRPETRQAYKNLVDQGWTDAIRHLYPNERIYTFWDYLRNAYGRDAGLRLDHFLLNKNIAPKLKSAAVDKHVRGWEGSSDHAPVWIELMDNKPEKMMKTKSFLDEKDSQTVQVDGCPLTFNHLSKVYWPEDGITKRDMFNYYDQVAEYMVPYLKDRPMSLHRFPNGIHGPAFYQKDVKDKAPDCMSTMPHTTSDGVEKEYLVAKNKASLLWMASLGCIEINPWFSRVQSPDNPDFCVIDLDPDKQHFDQVIEAAQEVRKVCDAIDVPCYLKTSGSTGIHIYIPLGAKYTYDQSQMFAKIIVTLVHKQIPEYTSLEHMVKNRSGKMYLDFLQNRPDATIAGVYSLRPKPGATVSMPVTWDEVKPGLTMKHFTIHNSIGRLKETGDLFKGVLGKGIDLANTIKKAQSVFSA